MSVELNWREGEEPDDLVWDEVDATTAAEPARTIISDARPRPGRSRTLLPFLLAVLAGILIGSAALAAFLIVRANQSNELARQDVQAAVALLLAAQASGDVNGYAQMLDPNVTTWRVGQIAGLRGAAPAALHAEVQSVRLQDDLAMAELIETPADGGETATRTAFFRLHSGRWLLTAPVAAMFGAPMQQASPHFMIDYRKTDKPAIHTVVDLAEGSYVALCGELRCWTSERPIPLALVYEDDPAANDTGLQVPSPRLIGVDDAGQPGEAFQNELTGALAIYLTADRFPETTPALQSAVGEWAVDDLTALPSPQIEDLRQAARRDNLLSLDEAWHTVVIQNRGGPLELTQVASLISFARETFGSGAVARLLAAAPAELPAELPDVLRRAFDVSYDDFNAGWQEWLQAGSPAADHPA